MGDLKVGDEVFDERGQVCRVEFVSDIELQDVYRVRFSDGSELIASGDHLWTTIDQPTRRAMIRDLGSVPGGWPMWEGQGRPLPQAGQHKRVCEFPGCGAKKLARGLCTGHYQQWRQGRALAPRVHPQPLAATRTTREIADTLRAGLDANHAIPAAAALECPDRELPIDPYALGVWLGDGHSRDGRVTTADPEIVAGLRDAGFDPQPRQPAGKATTYGTRGLHRLLRLNGLLGNKHVPAEYFRASRGQRLALLQGLMDTDGWVSKKTHVCEFTVTRLELAAAVRELAVGLGLVPTMGVGRAKLRGVDVGEKYRVQFSACGLPVFRVGYKAERAKKHGRTRQHMLRLRYVVAVEPAGKAFVRCIQVSSPSKLYLAGKAGIPTHNTTAAAVRTLAHCLTRPKALAMVFSPTRRQSQEFVRACLDFDAALGRPIRRERDNLSEVEWANGSRLLSLPDAQRGVVGFTPSLIVIDEASRVSDTLYKSVRPMLALGANLLTLSTPFGKRGWFFETWSDAARLARFQSWRVTAKQCPRISPEFLAEELDELGERWFNQEWNCSFEDSIDAVFAQDVIDAARADDIKPLFTMGA